MRLWNLDVHKHYKTIISLSSCLYAMHVETPFRVQHGHAWLQTNPYLPGRTANCTSKLRSRFRVHHAQALLGEEGGGGGYVSKFPISSKLTTNSHVIYVYQHHKVGKKHKMWRQYKSIVISCL